MEIVYFCREKRGPTCEKVETLNKEENGGSSHAATRIGIEWYNKINWGASTIKFNRKIEIELTAAMEF